MRTTIALLALAASVMGENVGEMIEKRNKLKTHSLNAPYVDSDLQNRWWDFGGDTIINTNKAVRLTQDRQSESGWLWSRLPLGVTNWQIEFEFAVNGQAASMFGDGFAFWLTRDRATPGPVFGSQDLFTGLGVFFDTYANSRHGYSFPRITAMSGDGKTPYDNDGDNAKNELAACSRNFRRRSIPTKARATYVKGHGLLFEIQLEEYDKWEKCFEAQLDLPERPFIGFSAHTGDVSDNHDIVSVTSYSITLLPEFRPQQAQQQAAFQGAQQSSKTRRKTEKRGGAASWFLFLLKLIGVLAFIAFAIAAYRTYSAQQSRRPAYY